MLQKAWNTQLGALDQTASLAPMSVSPRLPEDLRITLYRRRGILYPRERDVLNLVNYVASRIDKANILPVLHVFEVKESLSDIFTELQCSRYMENLGQLPVLHPILRFLR